MRDPVEQGALVAKIEDMLRATLAESDQLEQSAPRVDEARERSVRLQLEVAERKAAIRRSWLERESVASMIGAFLLLALGIALIVARFIGATPPEIVTTAPLLILGYFFGQTTNRKEAGEAQRPLVHLSDTRHCWT